MVKLLMYYTRYFVLLSFCLLLGCQDCQLDKAMYHQAVVGSYPGEMPTIPMNQKVVLLGGVFDVIHYSHLTFLKAAKKQGDYLVVAIEPDEFIEKYKRRKPVHKQKERAELLSHMSVVDAVIMLPAMKGYGDYLKLVKAVRPHIIAVTEGDPHQDKKEKQAAVVGAKVIPVVVRAQKMSTSHILRHMCK